MIRRTLLTIFLLVAGCVSLPTEEERRAALARQPLDSSYQLAVASWFNKPDIPTVGFKIKRPKSGDFNAAIRKIDRLLIDSGADWTYFHNTYNSRTEPSAFEKQLARRLADDIGVQPIFIQPLDIANGVKQEPNAVFRVKKIAREKGYDAFAIVSFQPYLEVRNQDILEEDDLRYSMTYSYIFVVRSVQNDELLYFKKSSLSCGQPEYDVYKLSGGATIRREKNNPNPIPQDQCEGFIHRVIIDEFISHIRDVKRL